MTALGSGNPTVRSRPARNGAYYTASVLYNAGFRGWPLVIMTAIAGRESSWNPTALNNDPTTQDYSVGLWQINYYGDLLGPRTTAYGSPAQLQSSPQAQANAAYSLAGGNNLTGLGNWALAPSPAQGQTPAPTSAGYSITPYLAAASSAAAEVGTFGPAQAATTGQATTWPGAGSQTAATGQTAVTTGSSSSASSGSGGCGAKGKLFSVPLVGWGITYCNLKAILGGLMIAGGALVGLIGIGIVVAGAGLEGRNKALQALAGPGKAVSSKVAPGAGAPVSSDPQLTQTVLAREREDRAEQRSLRAQREREDAKTERAIALDQIRSERRTIRGRKGRTVGVNDDRPTTVDGDGIPF